MERLRHLGRCTNALLRGERNLMQLMKTRQKPRRKLFWLILFWLIFVGYINLAQPSSVLSFSGFYLLLSLAIFNTLRTLLSLGKSIVWIGVILIYLILRQFHLDNILNTIILISIFVTFEIYFRKI